VTRKKRREDIMHDTRYVFIRTATKKSRKHSKRKFKEDDIFAYLPRFDYLLDVYSDGIGGVRGRMV